MLRIANNRKPDFEAIYKMFESTPIDIGRTPRETYALLAGGAQTPNIYPAYPQ